MKKYYYLAFALCFFSMVKAQTITIPDANFKAKLLAANTATAIAKDSAGNNIKIDTNNDGNIQQTEALLVFKLYINNSSITDLSGINSFTNLTYLECGNNQLTALDLYGLANLLTLRCSYNQLTNLPLADLNNLTSLACQNNQITTLTLSNLTQLTTLNCLNNQLTTLNLENSISLTVFDCSNNLLTSLFMKNGLQQNCFFSGNPGLQYICVDEVELSDIQSKVTTQYFYTNCQINTYCSFSPGGTYYTIKGNNRYDNNGNGCDAGDIAMPNLKLAFSDGTSTINLIANSTGSYQHNVLAGTQTITPVVENPTYFSISPPTATVTFPAAVSPFIQDFCLVANGLHNDLEITLFPINTVRPGVDAIYKITYKNKGTTTQSGTVNLVFDDAKMDFMLANPMTTSQTTNNLNWDFNNLLPFETREISVTLNINSPVETPAVIGGEVLNYTASIVGATDDTPTDNTSVLNQTVVNSLDPNDKTCLEGDTIAPDMVGKYVHYMIRFENSGTANAENVVVKDIINANSQFDISSLVPISGSHPFVTKISGTNKVEFIFENINLPFDDANNDGYVAFKIKTKPTLSIGSTFSNTASIYFDYNAPIVTNTAITTVTALGTTDFEFNNVFSLSPIPAKHTLLITAKESLVINTLSIYNTLGQLIQVNTHPNMILDVSALKTGTYFIKIMTDKGSAKGKFIKE